MKCLSLWQPWASVVFENDHKGIPVKPDETRPWWTGIRGPLAIHASKRKMTHDEAGYFQPMLSVFGLRWHELPLGVIIGTVEVVGCSTTQSVAPFRSQAQLMWGDYRQFGEDGKQRYAIEFRNAVKLTSPIPWRGSQKFFEVNL